MTRTGEGLDAYRVFKGQHEGKRPLGKPRLRWKDNIKMYLQEIERGRNLDWRGSRYGEVVCACVRGNESSVSIK